MQDVKPTFQHSFKLVLLLGVLLSVAASYVLYLQEVKRLTLAFDKNSEQLYAQLQSQANAYRDEINSLATLFYTNKQVTAGQFAIFSRSILSKQDHLIQNTFYIPKLTQADLPDYLQRQRQRLDDPNFTLIPDTRQPVMLPITYVTPSFNTIGMDIYNPSLPYRVSLDHARDSGEVTLTPPLTLMKDKLEGQSARDSFVMRQAIYDAEAVPATLEQRRDRFSGLVGLAFKADKILLPVLRAASHHHLALRLSDLGLYSDRNKDTKAPDTFYDTKADTADFWQHTPHLNRYAMEIGGRRWGIETSPSRSFATQVNTLVIGSPLVLLLVLTVILAIFVRRLSGEHSVALELAYRRADSDELTRLLSRKKVQDNLKERLAYCKQHQRQLAVLFVDLDHFKKINDTLGHSEGDKLLKLAARRLSGYVGDQQRIGRLGGDEFLILFEGDNDNFEQQVRNHCKIIIDKLSAPYKLSHRSLSIGCSIGIAFSPYAGSNADDLIKNADLAMYQAKKAGRLHLPGLYRQCRQAVQPARGDRGPVAQGSRQQRVVPALPAQNRYRQQCPGGVRSTDPLEQPQAGFCPAGRLHPSRRGQRPDCRAGGLDYPYRLPADPRLAGNGF